MTIPIESVLDDSPTKIVIVYQKLIDQLNAALDDAYANVPKGEMPSLRDLFAAFALMGHIANSNDKIDRDTRISSCWDYADRMLKGRKI